jgi:hypothetical protein
MTGRFSREQLHLTIMAWWTFIAAPNRCECFIFWYLSNENLQLERKSGIYLISFRLKSVLRLSTIKALCYIEFEVLTAVIMKRSIFWDITLCRLFKVDRYFGGICRLRLQRRIISQGRNQSEVCGNIAGRAYFSTLKAAAMSVEIQPATRHYIPECRTFYIMVYIACRAKR